MIILTHDSEGAAATLHRNDPAFLSRCLSLNTLGIPSLGAGSFRWAVEAKDALVRSMADCHVPLVANAVSIVDPPPLSLAPLESVWMSTDTVFKDELNDIALAFGKTLVVMDFFIIIGHPSQRNQVQFRRRMENAAVDILCLVGTPTSTPS